MRYPMLACIGFLALTTTVTGSLFPSPPLWNTLKTTVGYDAPLALPILKPIISTTSYNPVPRTLNEALANNWVFTSERSTCEDNTGTFNGFRLIEKVNGSPDMGTAVLYDANGIIAGIQMNFPATVTSSNPAITYKYNEVPMIVRNTINNVDSYSVTAYFVDPVNICTNGRTMDDLISGNGTGTNLYFQNGTTPSQNFMVPKDRSVANAQGWANDSCFPGMGLHNVYQQETWMADNCNHMLPTFLLYTLQNQLLGFGLEFVGVANSSRFEHPSGLLIRTTLGPTTPQCIQDVANTVGITSMHVFLVDPYTQNCLLPLN